MSGVVLHFCACCCSCVSPLFPDGDPWQRIGEQRRRGRSPEQRPVMLLIVDLSARVARAVRSSASIDSVPVSLSSFCPPLLRTAPSMAAPAASREEYLMQQFRALAQRHEISDYFAGKLRQLEGFEIVIICDDSGSMATPIGQAGPFAAARTRWDELKQTVSLMIEIAAVMDKDGLGQRGNGAHAECRSNLAAKQHLSHWSIALARSVLTVSALPVPLSDVYFMNRATLHGVTSPAQLAEVFASPPAGLTPTTPVLQHVLQAKKAISVEKKVLIVIATDGSPTNAQGEVDVQSLKHVMQSERNADRFFVTFIACTDDLSTVSYLNTWDKEMVSEHMRNAL